MIDKQSNKDGILKRLEEDGFTRAQLAVYKTRFLFSEGADRGRMGEILDINVKKRLAENTPFSDEEFDSMTYDELCFMHNSFDLFVDKEYRESGHSGEELHEMVEYILEFKRAVRCAVLARLRKSTLYVVLTRVNNLPLRTDEGGLFVFTSKDEAEGWDEYEGETRVLEVPPSVFDKVFSEYSLTGYEAVTLDLVTQISLSEFYHAKEDSEYGIHSPELCAEIINFNQMFELARIKAKEAKRDLLADEQKIVNIAAFAITKNLFEEDLIATYVDAERDGKRVKSAPVLTLKNDEKWMVLFTDAAAVSRFYKGKTEGLSVAAEALSDIYDNLVAKDSSFSGVIINPTRESFRVPSAYLARLSSEGTLPALQKKCRELQKARGDKADISKSSPEENEARRELAKKLLEAKRIFAAHDGDYISSFPFIREDGKAELFTRVKYGKIAEALYAAKNSGTLRPVPITSENFEGFFSHAKHYGVKSFYLDNGGTMTELLISDLYPKMGKDANVIEKTGEMMRGLALRELQLSYRDAKYRSKMTDEEKKNHNAVRNFLKALLYGELSVGLFYVIVPGVSNGGTTLYTPAALDVARARAAKHGMDEDSLIADCDNKYEVYDRVRTVLTVSKSKAKPTPFVAAFSDSVSHKRIEKVLGDSSLSSNHAAVAVTFDELADLCSRCGGFVLDPDAYGLTVTKDMIPKILEFKSRSTEI